MSNFPGRSAQIARTRMRSQNPAAACSGVALFIEHQRIKDKNWGALCQRVPLSLILVPLSRGRPLQQIDNFPAQFTVPDRVSVWCGVWRVASSQN